jgi:F-type H+-transporting ATPase subunit a
MTSLLASLFLAVAATQHSPAPAAEHGAADAPSAQHETGAAAAAGEHGLPAAEAAAAQHAGEHGEATEHGGEHAAAEHGEGGEEEHASLSEVMLGHVSDGYTLEFPWVCHGGFNWECEVNLKHVFGDSLVFGSIDMTPTKHLIMMWLASIVLLVVVFVSVRKRNLVPRGLYNFVEVLLQFVREEMCKKNIGEHEGDRYVPFLATAFFFILFVNLFGLVPWAATATGNIAVTLALSTFTFIITQYTAIRSQGVGGWLKHLTGGVHPLLWPIMVPVEILGLFTKPFALTIRLFANMVAGHIVILSLLGLIFALGSPFVAAGSVPMALGIFGLEIFVAFVQAFIFTLLSALFIGQGLAHHGHEEEHGAGEPAVGHAAEHGSHVAGKAPGHG